MSVVWLAPSARPGKKYTARIGRKSVHFGAAGMSDYTIHRDAARKQRYLSRHRSAENWTARGIRTPGFWSRWLLWGEPSLAASIAVIQRRFGLKIVRVTAARMARIVANSAYNRARHS